MSQPPKPPQSTNIPPLEEVMGNIESIDSMSPEQLAAVFAQLAEKVTTAPLEYKLSFGLTQIDAAMLDGIDLSTAEGRKKLASILRLLAQLAVSREKDRYLAGVSSDLTLDGGQNRPRGR